MANINTGEHVFIMVMGPNGPERREVKRTSSHHKVTDNIQRAYEEALRKNKRSGVK